MMRWIVGTSLKFRYLVLAIAAGLLYFGASQLRRIPVDVFPEFAPPLVEIQTPCLGLSPEEVEEIQAAVSQLLVKTVEKTSKNASQLAVNCCGPELDLAHQIREEIQRKQDLLISNLKALR